MYPLLTCLLASASALKEEIKSMAAKNFKNTSPVQLDVLNEVDRLEDLIRGHDVVVR